MKSKFITIFLILHLCVIWIEPCPPSCRCSKMTTFCKGINLHKVPLGRGYRDKSPWLGIPEHTTRLVLSQNNISSIRAHDFKEVPNLQMLIITDSHLAFFDTDVLKKFKNLVVLNLERNQLRKISKLPPQIKLFEILIFCNEEKVAPSISVRRLPCSSSDFNFM